MPPASICSDYYPLLGPYSSHDPEVVSKHMEYLTMSGIGTLIVCWWGRNDYTDTTVPLILDKAQEQGVKVGFLLDQYNHRSVFSVAGDIMYLYDRYGSHGAFYRDRRFNNRGVFYIYAPQERIDIRRGYEDWQEALDKLHADNTYNGIFLAQSSDVSVVEQGHFDGLFTYDVRTRGIEDTFFDIGSRLQEKGKWWSPSVGPGYMDIRNRGDVDGVKPRHAGETYDTMLAAALASYPTYISITSFNEWHEGTQIEPAKGMLHSQYSSYEENGLTGVDAENLYLNRTRYWVKCFDSKIPAV